MKPKTETYQSKIKEGHADPKSIRKLLKDLKANGKGNNDDTNLNINVHVGDRVVTNESDLTDFFNSYFANVASNLKEPIVPSDFEILNEYVKSKIPIQNLNF